MKRLLSRTYSDIEDYYGDCEFAVLIVTDELAKKILARGKHLRELQEKDEDINHITYSSYDEVMFFTQEDMDPELVVGFTAEACNEVEEGNWVELPDEFVIDEEKAQRLEFGLMMVFEDHIKFEYQPKHTELTVETSWMTYNEAEKYINGKSAG